MWYRHLILFITTGPCVLYDCIVQQCYVLLVCHFNAIAASPMVTTDPPAPAATIGSPLTLKCYASDCEEGTFTFTWRFNSQEVNSALVTSIGSNASQLTLDSVAEDDIGMYTCWVSNAVGTTIETFAVMEAGMLVRVHCMHNAHGLTSVPFHSIMLHLVYSFVDGLHDVVLVGDPAAILPNIFCKSCLEQHSLD